jgi:hypothetical protein
MLGEWGSWMDGLGIGSFIGAIKAMEVPGLILAALVIFFLFKALEKLEKDRTSQIECANSQLTELAKAYEKLSSLVETLVRRRDL